MQRVLSRLLVWPRLGWLTGPIFEKELRVISRRRRYYVLRFVYLALLTAIVGMAWYGLFYHDYGNTDRIARMADGGRQLVATLAWVQFIVVQLMAIVIMSNSISEEINKRTLGVLMSTPIRGFQIILGKLLGRLAPLLLILGVGLPLLAVLRVFGGIDWRMVIGSFCLTICVSLFYGSISMFYSIYNRRSYAVMLMTMVTAGVLYLGGAVFGYEVLFAHNENATLTLLSWTNPYAGMASVTVSGMGRLSKVWDSSWYHSSLVTLLATVLLLIFCSVLIRVAALRQALGEPAARPRRVKHAKGVQGQPPALPGQIAPAQEITGKIRHVWGNALLWKEIRTPLVPRTRAGIIGAILLGLILGGTYLLCAYEGVLSDGGTHIAYGIVFLLLGAVTASVVSATTITSEKEARTWPLLLLTDQTDRQILQAKALGSIRRCLPIWLLLLGHILVFTVAGIIHPAALVQVALVLMGCTIFITGSGLYFSSRFKSSTTAAVVNLLWAIGLWAGVPMFLSMLLEFGRGLGGEHGISFLISGNPIAQIAIILEATAGLDNATHSLASLRYSCINWGLSFHECTGILLAWAVAYCLAGLGFALLASRRLRKNVMP